MLQIWISCCIDPSWSLPIWVPIWGWGKLFYLFITMDSNLQWFMGYYWFLNRSRLSFESPLNITLLASNLWPLYFFLCRHNNDIILGKLAYIFYRNIGWFYHVFSNYKLKTCIYRESSLRTIKIGFRMETFATGHIVIEFMGCTTWYIYFWANIIQFNSFIIKANCGRVDKDLQTFCSKIFHALKAKNPITQLILSPWKKRKDQSSKFSFLYSHLFWMMFEVSIKIYRV